MLLFPHMDNLILYRIAQPLSRPPHFTELYEGPPSPGPSQRRGLGELGRPGASQSQIRAGLCSPEVPNFDQPLYLAEAIYAKQVRAKAFLPTAIGTSQSSLTHPTSLSWSPPSPIPFHSSISVMEDITTSEEEEYEGSDDSMGADYETDSEIERTQTNDAPPDNHEKELVRKLLLEGHQGPKVLVMLHEKGINMSARTLTRRRLEWGL
ncbi:hypothetical protein PCANC_13558 [Puccinia coronata f. sp. avenae]|uniref:Uncharacterized protein n=1 Tax=Puccinia coronata f. sp. avenae TaxID=200324 RepID=A0A2N5UCP8_9BASI|nr:hypothetical protein PCANC_24874 [Puccinia coronata f. sp. avenae]PLW35512.1 hypothetical protein PCANC_13558 [Puccinia coronata f. sp. avenae]